MAVSTLRIVTPGWSTTIQDRGRFGHAALGVPRGGAVDRPRLDLVNRLVGNDASAAGFETGGGLVLEAVEPVVLSTSLQGSVSTLSAGERLRIDRPDDGVWTYVGVRGGIAVEPVLGSRSHDTLSGLGPPPLSEGFELPVGADPRTEMTTDLAPIAARDRVVRLWPGPRSPWFLGALDELVDSSWKISGDVSRVGVRLSAGHFQRRHEAEGAPAGGRDMPSEGLVEGAIQITPSGEPIVMLANHPTTGGYPVVAVVDPDDVPVVAQSPPGSVLRFRPAPGGGRAGG